MLRPWTRYERDGTLWVPPELQSVARWPLYVQGLEYRLGEDHVSSVAAWVILHVLVGPLRRCFCTDGDMEPLVWEREQILADILAWCLIYKILLACNFLFAVTYNTLLVFIFVHVFNKKGNNNKKALLVVDPGGPSMCLCSGPGSDSGVNEGLVFLFLSA